MTWHAVPPGQEGYWAHLEVYDNHEDKDCGHEGCNVGHVLAIEGVLESLHLISAGEHEVEEGNDSAFKLHAARTLDCVWRECFPEYVFTDIRGDEKRYGRAHTMSLLEELIQADDNDAGKEQLHAGHLLVTGILHSKNRTCLLQAKKCTSQFRPCAAKKILHRNVGETILIC
jgi:hypothetical protein